MNKNREINLSKQLSFILRHRPESIGLELDQNGWASVQELVTKLNSNKIILNQQDLDHIVENNPKKRFTYSKDLNFIRANQGHSIDIDLQLKPLNPPEILYHGTSLEKYDLIITEGI